ncbi:MAG: LacI family transcriptional regulator [Lentisphaerae bacterium]|nr:LacI family transcriptional regulator [Lentisphaerota bacterium]
MTTLKDIAHALNISYSTVSAIMRGRGRELRFSESTCELVKAKAAELGYRPNLSAQALRSGRSYLVGVLVSNINQNVIIPGLLQGLDDVLIKYHMGMLVATYQSVAELNERVELMLARNVDGVVILPDNRPEYEEARLRLLHNRPAAGVGMDSTLYGIPWVFTAPDAASQITLEHLLQLGHRHFAKIIRHEKMDAVSEDLIRRAGGTFTLIEPEMGRRSWTCQSRFQAGERGFEMICQQRCPITAILAHNDFTAAGVIAAAAAKGFKVPQDLSVTGFDGAEISRCTLPALTTAAQPFELQGSAAGELLMRAINGEKNLPNVRLLPKLQIGGSSGPAGARLFT